MSDKEERNDNRAVTWMLRLMLFSGSVALAYGVVLPAADAPDSTISNLLLGAITLLLGIISWGIKKGYKALVDKIDKMGRQQQAFVVAVVQVTVETHPDKAEKIMSKFAPLLRNGWGDKA